MKHEPKTGRAGVLLDYCWLIGIFSLVLIVANIVQYEPYFRWQFIAGFLLLTEGLYVIFVYFELVQTSASFSEILTVKIFAMVSAVGLGILGVGGIHIIQTIFKYLPHLVKSEYGQVIVGIGLYLVLSCLLTNSILRRNERNYRTDAELKIR